MQFAGVLSMPSEAPKIFSEVFLLLPSFPLVILLVIKFVRWLKIGGDPERSAEWAHEAWRSSTGWLLVFTFSGRCCGHVLGIPDPRCSVQTCRVGKNNVSKWFRKFQWFKKVGQFGGLIRKVKLVSLRKLIRRLDKWF